MHCKSTSPMAGHWAGLCMAGRSSPWSFFLVFIFCVAAEGDLLLLQVTNQLRPQMTPLPSLPPPRPALLNSFCHTHSHIFPFFTPSFFYFHRFTRHVQLNYGFVVFSSSVVFLFIESFHCPEAYCLAPLRFHSFVTDPNAPYRHTWLDRVSGVPRRQVGAGRKLPQPHSPPPPRWNTVAGVTSP